MRAKKIVITIVVVVLALVAVAAVILLRAAQTMVPAQEESNAIEVVTARPETMDIENTMDFVGTLSAADSVNVMPKMSAEVSNIAVKPGDSVTAGQVLFTMSTEDLDNQMALSELALLAAQLNYEMTTGITLPKNENSAYIAYDNARDSYDDAEDAYEDLVNNSDDHLEAMDLQIQAAKTNLENEAVNLYGAGTTSAQAIALAQKDLQDAITSGVDADIAAAQATYDKLKGLQTIYDASVASKTSYQGSLTQANAVLDSSERGYDSAKIAYESVSGEAREIQEDLAEIQLNQAQINYQSALDQLGNATVTAPIDGVVLSLSVSLGNAPAMNSAVAVIGSPSSMELSFGVPVAYYTDVLTGSDIAVSAADQTSPGTISEITHMVQQGSGVFNVKAQTVNPGGTWLSGTSATVTLTTERAQNALAVPVDCVRFESGNPYVYINDGGFAKKVFITLGITDEQYYEILDGLSASDRVITTWHPNLTDGVELSDEQGG